MERSRTAIWLGLLLCLPALSVTASTESYYTTNLDDAVEAARRNPVNSNYVGARWYNRTTSRSFNLPPMLNTEMDQEVIEGAMGPTASGEAAAAQAQQPARDAALGRQTRSDALDDTSSDNKKRSRQNDNADSTERVEVTEDIFIREARSPTSVTRDIRASNVGVKASVRP